ncbi:DMT family transporter [Blochmannia endosymbiont of Polyrhachis (Hedomyrma) turneri]|uniref:DMT family transporter n=1 Tax=Blochmannia endosymbiont of Polyrhachis (Hedomyrma) turneri TaxID=1505596 RepID=UPI00061A7617|nr:DMT family transporter [Blochmannia endosymbiont of Polyrhachis (Hedomyrma) turneri]AKC59878.1 inner membrane protein ytfF [Blochmannia endosymbiont of Polyrhachis (Hedomyrma) turneri]
MIAGLLFSLGANLLWGLIFIGPLLVPEYPGVLQAAARYVAFGIITLPLSWFDRNRLFKLLRKDWIEAIKLVLVGNLIYYACLTNAIQRTGSLISTIIIGTLPAVLAITANLSYTTYNKKDKLSWNVLLVGLCFIVFGLICVNLEELQYTLNIFSFQEYFSGIILAVVSVICWTWYALRNAKWLKQHSYSTSMTWTIAQGIVLLPLSFIFYVGICIFFNIVNSDFILPLGPRPKVFILLMFAIGFLCSWVGTFFWNEASQRLPTVFMGPLIVFETIFGLLYTFIHRKICPSFLTLFGILLLIVGVVYISSTKLFLIKKDERSVKS